MNIQKTKNEIIAFVSGITSSFVLRFVIIVCNPNCPDGNAIIIWFVLLTLLLVVAGGVMLFFFTFLRELEKTTPAYLAGFGIGAGGYAIIAILQEF